MSITFGGNVRFLSSRETYDRALAGRTSQVYGETTPSVRAVEVIGEVKNDYKINVSLEGEGAELWFVPEILEIVDHAQDSEIVIGIYRAVRRADRIWDESGTSWLFTEIILLAFVHFRAGLNTQNTVILLVQLTLFLSLSRKLRMNIINTTTNRTIL